MRAFLIGGVAVAMLGAAGPAAAHHRGLLALDEHPGASLNISADLGVGKRAGDDIPVRPLAADPRYGCFRAHGRTYIVELATREVVEIWAD